jgi:hypothetical protein
MKVYKKGDAVKLAPHEQALVRWAIQRDQEDYLMNRQHLRGVVIEVRDKGDNIVPIHRVWWAVQRQHEWHYAEDLRSV